MDVPREVDTDLENLNQNILRGGTDDFFPGLQRKYSETLSQIREKHVVDGSTLQRDGLGQALLPEDIPLTKKMSQLVAYQSTGNGDCIFNTCSRLLVGDDSLSVCLRLLTALELVTNKEYYAKHPKLEEFIHTNETRITHRFWETRKKTLDKKRYDKTTTRLQSSLESPSSLVSHNRDSILTIETRFSQSRLDSHNRVSFLTIESCPYNRVSFL